MRIELEHADVVGAEQLPRQPHPAGIREHVARQAQPPRYLGAEVVKPQRGSGWLGEDGHGGAGDWLADEERRGLRPGERQRLRWRACGRRGGRPEHRGGPETTDRGDRV